MAAVIVLASLFLVPLMISCLVQFGENMPPGQFVWNPPQTPLICKLVSWPLLAFYFVIIGLPLLGLVKMEITIKNLYGRAEQAKPN